jgi:hypothetical protein
VCRTFHFSSILQEEYREDVEKLLYFNPLQTDARGAIVASLEDYGQPRVSTRDGFVHLTVEGMPGVQTIYALTQLDDGERLAGVLIYGRKGGELVILHITLDEPFSSGGSGADEMLALRLIVTVQQIARRIKGVRAIVFRDLSGRICRRRVISSPS